MRLERDHGGAEVSLSPPFSIDHGYTETLVNVAVEALFQDLFRCISSRVARRDTIKS